MKAITPLTPENILEKYGCITYKIAGKSMEPMIYQNRDIVTIRKISNVDILHENDVVLYREKGKYVLHRIIEICQNGDFVILGDNCSRKEYGISYQNIIGVLISFKRDGIHYEISDPKYIDYVSRLRNTESIRMRRKLVYEREFGIRSDNFSQWDRGMRYWAVFQWPPDFSTPKTRLLPKYELAV